MNKIVQFCILDDFKNRINLCNVFIQIKIINRKHFLIETYTNTPVNINKTRAMLTNEIIENS